jgi:hypothetical protein
MAGSRGSFRPDIRWRCPREECCLRRSQACRGPGGSLLPGAQEVRIQVPDPRRSARCSSWLVTSVVTIGPRNRPDHDGAAGQAGAGTGRRSRNAPGRSAGPQPGRVTARPGSWRWPAAMPGLMPHRDAGARPGRAGTAPAGRRNAAAAGRAQCVAPSPSAPPGTTASHVVTTAPRPVLPNSAATRGRTR